MSAAVTHYEMAPRESADSREPRWADPTGRWWLVRHCYGWRLHDMASGWDAQGMDLWEVLGCAREDRGADINVADLRGL